jgi:antitoxin PrlF
MRCVTVVMKIMAIASSKITAQGQISVPAEVRRKLGVGPGSILEWSEKGDQVVVRRAGRFTSRDVQAEVFAGKPPARRTLAEMKEGVRRVVRKRNARH